MQENDVISDLERQINFLITYSKAGNIQKVAMGITYISQFRIDILRQGIPLPKDLDQNTLEGNLNIFKSQAYTIFITNEIDILKDGLAQKEPEKVYNRLKVLNDHKKNLIGEAKTQIKERISAFNDDYSIALARKELSEGKNFDIKIIRRYYQKIISDETREKLYEATITIIEANESPIPRFFNPTYDGIVKKIINKTNGGEYLSFSFKEYKKALELYPSTDKELLKYIAFLKEFSSKSINQYMDDLVQREAVKNGDVRGLKPIFVNVLYPAAEMELVDINRVKEIHQSIYPSLVITSK